MRQHKIKGWQIELQQRQWLHSLSYSFLGLQEHNAWHYPDIFDWDWCEETGSYEIPALITFYFDQRKHISLETARNFERQIKNATGERYEFQYHWSEGYIVAVRRHINKRYNYYVPKDIQAPIHEVSRWFSTLEWEQKQHEWAEEITTRNGFTPGKNGDSMR